MGYDYINECSIIYYTDHEVPDIEYWSYIGAADLRLDGPKI